MAEIHHTTMAPTKLELLTDWLPRQPWYEGEGGPDLVRAGGFRLDDPEGEVGIELMVVVDRSGTLVRYLVPMTYRGEPMAGAEAALIGTSEHGVLGTRWIYDGERDPVAVDQLVALLRGRADPQQQSESWTPDPTVEVRGDTGSDPATWFGVDLVRVLSPGESPAGAVGAVVAGWQLPDGTEERGVVLLARDHDPR